MPKLAAKRDVTKHNKKGGAVRTPSLNNLYTPPQKKHTQEKKNLGAITEYRRPCKKL